MVLWHNINYSIENCCSALTAESSDDGSSVTFWDENTLETNRETKSLWLLKQRIQFWSAAADIRPHETLEDVSFLLKNQLWPLYSSKLFTAFVTSTHRGTCGII